MFNIEKDIPLPEPRGARTKYPFEEMEIGDSFLFDKKQVNLIHFAKSQYGRRNNKKFSVRRINNDEYRCWRIE